MGFQPSYRTEAQIYTKYMLANVKQPKMAILYQNDDFGKDYPLGVRDVLGTDWDKIVARNLSYETTDATVDLQIAEMQSVGCNVLLVGGIAKFAAQSIRKVYEVQWKPMFFMSNVSVSVGMVMQPAGPEKSIGMISTQYLKDPTDVEWKDDAGLKAWRAFMAKYLPNADLTDAANVFAYGAAMTMVQVLKQCGGDFSRANVMRQAENLHDFEVPGTAAGDQGQHQPYRPSADQGDATATVERQGLGPVRRPD